MEPPALWDAEMMRDHKVEVLKAVRPIDPGRDAVRGRSAAGLVEGVPVVGYHDKPGVDPNSRTETFTAVRLYLDTWRWEGVPVMLRSGKRLASKAHEVVFRFREPPTRLFRHTALEHVDPNWLVFRMSPDEAVELVVRTKRPGLELEAASRCFAASYATDRDSEASAYEGLLLDVLEGDHTPFLRFDEVEWSWRIVDPILKAWQHKAPRGLRRRKRRPHTASTVSSIPGTPGGPSLLAAEVSWRFGIRRGRRTRSAGRRGRGRRTPTRRVR